jgi:outer membrane protein assembly factor BamD
LLIIACAPKKDDLKNKSADELYAKGKELLKTGEYSEAADVFGEIESLFPYSSRASEGQILSAYSHFMAHGYMDASRGVEIFLRYHPSHNLAPYAMYLRAMCIYVQVSSVGRDARIAHDAKQAFIELVNRFPNSKYRADSVKRIIILDDIIAAHEMMIGRYYQKNNSILSAIGRYNLVIGRFRHTNHAAEACYRMVECCESEGLEAELMAAYELICNAFSSSKWRKKADLIIARKKNSHKKTS